MRKRRIIADKKAKLTKFKQDFYEKQVSTLSLIALAAFSIWQYFTEHKRHKPALTTTQQQSQSAVKIPKILEIMMSSCAMMPLDKIKTPLLITICWPYLGRLHSVKTTCAIWQ